MRQFYVYVLAGKSRQLYVGVTNDLLRRLFEHRSGQCKFTSKYYISRLVYFETTKNIMSAIEREKQIKAWRRSKKLALISSLNPGWDDLAEDLFGKPTEVSSEQPVRKEESGNDV